MGWLFMPRPRNVRDYLRDTLTWETEKVRNRCVDIAMKLNVAYAAVETIDKSSSKREVWAAVFLMKYIRGEDPYNWGYKDLTEHTGPVEAECPARILDLLTDTDNTDALHWRQRCRAALEKRMPKIGTRVRFLEPVRFKDGTEEEEFTVVKVGGRTKALQNQQGRLFRISRDVWRTRDWSIVDKRKGSEA